MPPKGHGQVKKLFLGGGGSSGKDVMQPADIFLNVFNELTLRVIN